MKTKLTHNNKQDGNVIFAIIIGLFVIVPIAGIGVGLLIHYLFFTEIIVPNPPPAPMIEDFNEALLTPMECNCGGNCPAWD